MIENVNASKVAGSGESFDKFIGVTTCHVVAINPNNAALKKFGWTIADDADEPQYVTTTSDGKKNARVRFLVQMDDFKDKPAIALDFWVRPEYRVNADQTKCQIIDKYGRAAWATKEEIKGKKVPQYKSGPANISTPYKLAHGGEEELVTFLMKLLNVTPLQIFKRDANNVNGGEWVNNTNPGSLTIDKWGDLCDGKVGELQEYVSLMPDNRLKVILGVRYNNANNRWYQTFLNTGFLGNAAYLDLSRGFYPAAQNLIAKFNQGNTRAEDYQFEAGPVRIWTEKTSETEVKPADNQILDFGSSDFAGSADDDLPFD